MAVAVDQRLSALAEANRIRSERASLKRRLKAGDASIDQAFEHPDFQKAEVWMVLIAVKGVGQVKALKVLRRVGVSASRPVGALTGRERGAIVEALGGRA